MSHYSANKIKNNIILGCILSGLDMLIIFGGIFLDSVLIKVVIGVILVVINIFYVINLFLGIYKPNLELQRLVEEYKSSQALGNSNIDDKDLIQEVRDIILSLDAMTIKQKNAEILMKNAEINNLQDQINPHFLYNTLEVIRGEALIKGEKKIAEMTASLANYFRYNISRKETFVFLKDELKNSMNYFNIQKNRFGDKISCEILYHDVDENEIGNCYIPKLILQPLIENAIYHGLELKMGEGILRIHITSTRSSLKISITDDGLGMTKEQLNDFNSDFEKEHDDAQMRNNGVATKNIKKRLKLYWGNKAYMVATSELGVGTEIHLSMPLLYEKEEYMN